MRAVLYDDIDLIKLLTKAGNTIVLFNIIT